MTEPASDSIAPAQLRLEATAAELRALGAALRRLYTDEPDVFAALFSPQGGGDEVELDDDTARLLASFGLVAGAPRRVGLHRIRHCDGRFYVMELGGVREYRQDVWPETDALLAVLAAAPPGRLRLLDMGTGTGIVAIEAAARGHRVVATDLYATALDLARFNARLNGLADIDFRCGHLFEPVRGETFDLVLTAPHYTRVADQLRLETLRTGPELLGPGGRLVVATFCEWEADGPLAAAEVVLRPLAARGFDVAVTPLHAAFKREWFTVAQPEVPTAGLVSRHRFLVDITRSADGRAGPGQLRIERPPPARLLPQRYVPLSRLALGPAADSAAQRRLRPALATVTTAADVAALQALWAGLDAGELTLHGEVPTGLLDACRYGAVPCVTPTVVDGAAGAILDAAGAVRPCAHGQPLGRATDTMADVAARLTAEAAAAAARRGCAQCPAAPRCSRCLFPFPLDEATYWNLMRAQAARLPLLHRLLATLGRLRPLAPPLRIKLRPAPAASPAAAAAPDSLDPQLTEAASRWRQRQTWLVTQADRRCTFLWLAGAAGDELVERDVTPELAAIGELIADGLSGQALRTYLRERDLAPDLGERVLSRLCEWLA